MFNQQVDFTFFADDSGKGYWTYSPLKYWPANASSVQFCAYAPYVESPGGTSGIIGMAPNTATTPYIIYARVEHPEDYVDLLWAAYTPGERKPVRFTVERDDEDNIVADHSLNHALARLRVNLTQTAAIPSGVKVLIERVRLSGTIASTGRLNLTGTTRNGSGQYVPTWTDQVTAATDIDIYCDPEHHADSYGIIAEDVRYVADLPYSWQPAGLSRNTRVNVLCMGDYPSYIYLIPQSGGVSLTCTVYYALVYNDGTATKHKLRKTATATTVATTGDTNTALNGHLNGNTTYDLNLSFAIETE